MELYDYITGQIFEGTEVAIKELANEFKNEYKNCKIINLNNKIIIKN